MAKRHVITKDDDFKMVVTTKEGIDRFVSRHFSKMSVNFGFTTDMWLRKFLQVVAQKLFTYLMIRPGTPIEKLEKVIPRCGLCDQGYIKISQYTFNRPTQKLFNVKTYEVRENEK